MTSKQLDIDDALIIVEDSMPWDIRDYETSAKTLAAAYRAKCAEVEELKELIEEVVPVGDISDGLAPYYIEADTIRRMRKALDGKE